MFNLAFFTELPSFNHHMMSTLTFFTLGTVTAYFYNKIATEEIKTMYICAWLVCVVADKLFYSLYASLADINFQQEMTIAVNAKTLSLYSKLNHAVKCKEPLAVHQRKIANIISYFEFISSFGVYMVINLFSASVDVCITLKDMPYVLGTIWLVMLSFTYYVINDMSMRDARKNHIARRDELANLLILEETYFSIGKKSFHTMIDIMTAQFDNQKPIRDARRHKSDLMVSNETLIIAGTLYACYHMESSINLVNIIRVLISFSSAIRTLGRFFQMHSESKMKYDEYAEFWKKNEHNVIDDPDKLDFPEEFKIHSIDYRRPENNYYLEMNEELTLVPGVVLKIAGGTGLGKSAFCDLMLGRDIINNDSVSAMTLEVGQPRQFMHHMCECGQDTSTQLNWSVSTVRQHFEGEMDDDKILHFCDLMFIKDKVLSLGFDEPIEKSVSGVEQQRITLASNLYYADKHKSKVLIFDEPEKGLGVMAKDVLDRLALNNRDAIVIISTHVQDWIMFNKHLLVTREGDVSKIGLVE